MTHAEGIKLAAKWLRKHHCVVLTEIASAAREEPDAIGFLTWGSTIVEVKTSHRDFLADQKKPWRHFPIRGLGQYRYYLAPIDMIEVHELPEGWGLLEVGKNGAIARRVKASRNRDYGIEQEHKLLLSVIRRIGNENSEDISIKKYTYKTKCRGTVGIATGDG